MSRVPTRGTPLPSGQGEFVWALRAYWYGQTTDGQIRNVLEAPRPGYPDFSCVRGNRREIPVI